MIKIGICGYAGSGKTTFAEMVRSNLLHDHGHRAAHLNFADALKEVAYTITGQYAVTEEDKSRYLNEWGMTMRYFLQWLGTDVLRSKNPDVWVRAWEIKSYHTGCPVVLCSDVRFPNEVEVFDSVYRIKRHAVFAQADHPSEVSLDKLKLPIIENSGSLTDLEDKASWLAGSLSQKINKLYELGNTHG